MWVVVACVGIGEDRELLHAIGPFKSQKDAAAYARLRKSQDKKLFSERRENYHKWMAAVAKRRKELADQQKIILTRDEYHEQITLRAERDCGPKPEFREIPDSYIVAPLQPKPRAPK